jgi:hypothetical protein
MAARLESKYPEAILAFYVKGLGDAVGNDDRQGYANKAAMARLIRHVWIDVLKTPEKWEAFARQLKVANRARRAFQDEFAKVVPGWTEL